LGFFRYGFGDALPSDVSGLDILLSDSAIGAEWSHGSNLKQSGVETENRMITVNLKPVGVRQIRRGQAFTWASFRFRQAAFGTGFVE